MKILVFAFLIFSPLCFAKSFSSSFMSMQLPDDWSCEIESKNWSCAPEEQTPIESIVIVSARVAGVADTLTSFRNTLSKPRSIQGAKGLPLLSKVEVVKDRTVSGVDWIESLHLSSELENYYTWYLATSHNNLAILITFSAHKSKLEKYRNIFGEMMDSIQLKVPEKLAKQSDLGSKDASEKILSTAGSSIPKVQTEEVEAHLPWYIKFKEKLFILFVIGVVILVYLAARKRM